MVNLLRSEEGPLLSRAEKWLPRAQANFSPGTFANAVRFSGVSVDDDKKEIAQLERVNAELSRSLARCRALLHDCKSKLAANSNDPPSADDKDDEDSGLG